MNLFKLLMMRLYLAYSSSFVVFSPSKFAKIFLLSPI